MAKLIWTDESLESLREIGGFLTEKSPQASASVTEGIWQRTQILKQFPKSGWGHDEIGNRDVRSLVYGHYRIVYEIISEDEVRVIPVLHSSIDIGRLRL